MRIPHPVHDLVDALAARLESVTVEAWDGYRAGPAQGRAVIRLSNPRSLIRIARAPRGLGLGRACVDGDIQLEGDLVHLARHEHLLFDPRLLGTAFQAVLFTLVTSDPQDRSGTGRTELEFAPARCHRRSRDFDSRAVSYHYDVPRVFYETLLGPAMTYSCALFDDAHADLVAAQHNKHARISQKLRLGKESRLLDVGCGWGGMLQHASSTYGCHAVGITASGEQAKYLRDQLLPENVQIRHGDYRDFLPMRGYSAACGIGVYEHIGRRLSPDYFRRVYQSLESGGRFVNQTILRTRPGRAGPRRNSFAERYVFPNGELLTLGDQLADIAEAGFRVISVEMFGDSYARTISCWLNNLAQNRDICVRHAGEGRVRVWELYLSGAQARFEARAIDLVQVLMDAP